MNKQKRKTTNAIKKVHTHTTSSKTQTGARLKSAETTKQTRWPCQPAMRNEVREDKP